MSVIQEEIFSQEPKPWEFIQSFRRIRDALNGRVGIGSTVGLGRNFDGEMLDVTFGAANTEQSIAHTLRSTPVGFLVIRNSNGGVIYDGATGFFSTQVFLQSTVADTVARIFLLR